MSGPPEVKFRTELSRRIKILWFQSENKLIHDTEHVNMRVSVAVMCAPVPRLSERYRQEYLCLCSVVCPRLMRVRRLCQKTNRIVCVSLSLTFNNPIHPHESMRDSRAVVMAPRASVSSFHFIIVLRINSNWISPECCHHCWFYIVLIERCFLWTWWWEFCMCKKSVIATITRMETQMSVIISWGRVVDEMSAWRNCRRISCCWRVLDAP